MAAIRIMNDILKSLCLVAVLAISFAKNGKLTSLAFSFDAINTASSIHRANACHKLFCDGLALFATKDVSIALSSSRLPPMSEFHTVQGIQCREVANELPIVGSVIVLEATADAQEELVDECLELEEDDENDSKQKRIAEGDPYGAVLWPAAWAVSNYLLTKPDFRGNLSSLSILELGTGTGLVSIAAAMGGAKRVIATDYEPLALDLTRYAADNLNKNLSSNNNVSLSETIETSLLDLCDLKEQPLPIEPQEASSKFVVVAADIMYEPNTGIAMAHRAVEALRQNCRVIVGDSPGRAGRPAFLKTLRELGVDEGVDFQETIGKTCSGPRHDLICGKGSTSVSETPQELTVALLDLKPSMLKG